VSGSAVFGYADTETNGRWGPGAPVRGQTQPGIGRVSCSSAGNGAAGGNLGPNESDSGGTNGAFVFSEHHGRWGKAGYLTGPANGGTVTSPQCVSAGNCAAGGSGFAGDDENGDELIQAFAVSEPHGRWTAAGTPPGEAALNLGSEANSQVNSVSCPSASSCVAGGYYSDAAGHGQAFVDGSE
jgi:hypothetical protein